jgi:hypothetical protein
MSFVKIVREVPSHERCERPGVMAVLHAKAGIGSVWECEVCKKKHVYIGSDMGAALWREATTADL